jgi:hypothetical protein
MSSARSALPPLAMQNLEKISVNSGIQEIKNDALLLDTLHLKRHQRFKAAFVQMRKVYVWSRFRCFK